MTTCATFYGWALFGDEIRVFPNTKRAGTPTVCHYGDVRATFPNTRKGLREAAALAYTLTDAGRAALAATR